MAYKDITVLDLEERFGVTNKKRPLFPGSIPLLEPSEQLQAQLQDAATIPMRTEKARSELIVPLLLFKETLPEAKPATV